VAAPDTSWTWPTFLEAVQKLTTGTGAARRYGTARPDWQTRVRDNGGHLLDTKRTSCLLDQAPAVDGIQWTADLRVKWQVVPTDADLKQQSAQERFLAGNLAIYPLGNYFQGIPITAKVKFQWDLAPLPTGTIGRRPLSGGANFCLPTGVKSPDASWRFLKYMGGPEGATFRGKDAGLFPPLPALATPEVIPTFTAAQIKSILDSGQDAYPLPFIPKYDQMDKIISAGLAPVWAGTATAREATAKIVPQVNALLQD
jgi:multiple sugar transport system substrate-binding protein